MENYIVVIEFEFNVSCLTSMLSYPTLYYGCCKYLNTRKSVKRGTNFSTNFRGSKVCGVNYYYLLLI